MVRLTKDSANWTACKFVTNEIFGKAPKRETRPHINYYRVVDGKIMKTNGKYFSVCEMELPEMFENGFYELIKRNKTEIIFERLEDDWTEYPELYHITDTMKKHDTSIPAGKEYMDYAITDLIQATGAIYNFQAIINCMEGFEAGYLLCKSNDIAHPICIEESHNGLRNRCFIMPKLKQRRNA